MPLSSVRRVRTRWSMASRIGRTCSRDFPAVLRRTKSPSELDCDADPLCCAPLSGAVLDRQDAVRLAQVLRAVADPARLQVISLIRAAPGGEVCVADLVRELGLSQPTVSHHLRVL